MSRSTTQFELPGRDRNVQSNPEHNALKATFAKSLAYSRVFNNRNLEHMWYPYWCSTLFDLVANRPHLIVAPQYPLYFSNDDVAEWHDEKGIVEEEPEGPEDGCDFDNIDLDLDWEVSVTGGEAASVAGASSESSLADESMEFEGYSFSTTPGRGVSEVFADFAVLHVEATRTNAMRPNFYRYDTWDITRVSVPLLVEEKRFASRSLGGNKLKQRINVLIGAAAHQLLHQAAHVFLRDSAKILFRITEKIRYFG
jgi:hypothetical protein